MQDFRYLKDVVTLALNQAICIGCGCCIEVCPHQVFAMDGGQATLADRDACMECGACALNCPVRAIAVDSGVGCASGMINRWLAGFNIRLRSDDSCC